MATLYVSECNDTYVALGGGPPLGNVVAIWTLFVLWEVLGKKLYEHFKFSVFGGLWGTGQIYYKFRLAFD